jgi:hypothetical protein
MSISYARIKRVPSERSQHSSHRGQYAAAFSASSSAVARAIASACAASDQPTVTFR